MKHLLTLLAVLFSLASFAQSNIYNPDSDNDGLITAEDLLIFLSNFGNDFTPNPCNCGCYANPFYEPYAVNDTLNGYEVAANIFNSQPDSIRLDFVVAPFGAGWMPFSDIDTIFYDTLTFTQTYDMYQFDVNGSNAFYGSGNPHMVFRHNTTVGSVSQNNIHGGLDIYDYGFSPNGHSMKVEAASICPNLDNDEYWTLYNATEWFQVEEGVYVNVNEFASPSTPVEASAEYPSSWLIFYPLNWLVITEIFNDSSE